MFDLKASKYMKVLKGEVLLSEYNISRDRSIDIYHFNAVINYILLVRAQLY